ncbi:hypothetical protein [Brevibacillus centrosporus]|jgi:flagellar biosynthesis/type III secretory pathway M-ring protein FliF/YscJ|uniref:Uncharacterized protein n=1 Tax=Brevibacillus centrosporus TaxID=54910 RepID=A0A1I3NSF8_9BACL|nr:hypothetical protein [Brevibacillus centrosporus]MEC2128463.1 hypothetical protein [Brevibacillus centrosporus]MED4909886.1 hypothetical protein [Brevibacillus centrosporus]RNB73695.1 hypothetical protein EDM55_01570 [Brevibacillus centrosporus]SFJ12215.1 hypothetical protein SAMN05518846_102159 [Brevibacillus centrosporus]GED29038.1 hypothetical protein BCE02nite_01790 [Brevibacillus centrosporus]
MKGTLWINSGLGILAFVVTLATAWASNVWLVSLERAGVAFILFFLVAFPVRWIISKVTQPLALSTMEEEDALQNGAASPVRETEDQQSEASEESFAPLAVSQMERIRPIEDPTTVAEVVRRLTDE